MELFYKSTLADCGHPELYDKMVQLGMNDVSQAMKRVRENQNILTELGISDTLEQEKIIGALQSGTNKVMCVMIFGMVGIIWVFGMYIYFSY